MNSQYRIAIGAIAFTSAFASNNALAQETPTAQTAHYPHDAQQARDSADVQTAATIGI